MAPDTAPAILGREPSSGAVRIDAADNVFLGFVRQFYVTAGRGEEETGRQTREAAEERQGRERCPEPRPDAGGAMPNARPTASRRPDRARSCPVLSFPSCGGPSQRSRSFSAAHERSAACAFDLDQGTRLLVLPRGFDSAGVRCERHVSAVLAQMYSSEMRGSDDDDTSRVVRAGPPTAGRAWACGLAVGWPLVWFCVRVGG